MVYWPRQHAIAQTADEVYAPLDEAGQDIARRLFLRLVHVSDDAPETRGDAAQRAVAGAGRAGFPGLGAEPVPP